MIPYVTREPTGGEWRVGRHYGIHVYEDDRPVATFHDPADAERAVAAVNSWRRVTTGDPTEPEPLAMQARELLVAIKRVRELHSPVDRGTGPQCRGCATHVTFTPWPCATTRALDGEPQP